MIIVNCSELSDYLWLHIRCAGGWTNQLYDHFEQKLAQVRVEKSHSEGQPLLPYTRRPHTDGSNLRNTGKINRATRKSAFYTYSRLNLNVINMPVPLDDDKFGKTRASQVHRRLSRKPVNKTMPTPRQTFAPNTIGLIGHPIKELVRFRITKK